jgi:hypothetical protein
MPCLPLKPKLAAPQAIVFDFDGVIVNTEPLHLQASRDALATRGIGISDEEYYSRYVGYDDVGMFRQLAIDRSLPWCSDDLQEMLVAKALRFEQLERVGAALVPGAAECVRRMADLSPLAIASGARPDEIERMLTRLQLRSFLRTMVGSGPPARTTVSHDCYRRHGRRSRLRQSGRPALHRHHDNVSSVEALTRGPHRRFDGRNHRRTCRVAGRLNAARHDSENRAPSRAPRT